MNQFASNRRSRFAFLRWAVVTVPAINFLGVASSRLAPMGSDNPWYQALIKPELNPPGWAFGVAWTILYVLMGLSLAMVLDARRARGRGLALLFFALQMIANLAWSPLFFGLHRITAALIVIVVMFALTVVTTLLFARIRSAAALLLIPYLLWMIFAGYLNLRIDQRNPDADGHLVSGGAATQIAL